DNIIMQARKQAGDIICAAKKEAEEKKAKILDAAMKNAGETRRRMIAAAELEVRKIKLGAKQELIGRVFGQAAEALNSLPVERYKEMISGMIVYSAKTGDEEIVLNKRDKERMDNDFINTVNAKLREKGLKGNLKISGDTAAIKGGFILRKENVEINNSFEAMIRMKYNEIEPQVVKILFG
ncbi:MAG: hypothetical protein GX754_12335, partial [Clostridiaceae bacterium]|nr:hypothetical protein [Clostridiaceae bacterium]